MRHDSLRCEAATPLMSISGVRAYTKDAISIMRQLSKAENE